MNEIIRYNSTDKDIAAVKCYVRENLNGSPLYRDKDRTELIPKEEAIELFNKGLITVDYGESGGLMNAKPIFIVDGEIEGIELDEEAGYGVIFFIGNGGEPDNSEVVTCYVNNDMNGSPLYRDREKNEIIPKEEAIELFNKGLITVDYGGSDDGFMNGKPIFITDFELAGAEFVEGAGYGVIFYIPSDNEGFQQLYMNIGDEGPTGMLYFESDFATMVPFSQAVEFVEKGNAIVYIYDGDNMLFAGKPTCVLRSEAVSGSYEVKFPL